MNCPNCGKEIADDSIFCEFCGEKVKKGLASSKWIANKIYLTCFILLGLLSIIGLGNLFDHHFIAPTLIVIGGCIFLIAIIVLYLIKKISFSFFILSLIQTFLLSVSAFLCYDADTEDFDFCLYPFVAITFVICIVF